VATRILENNLSRGMDLNSVRTLVKEEVSRFLYGRTKRRPMVLPVLIEI
jgi:mRNA degradation ribonuclease J1/J2